MNASVIAVPIRRAQRVPLEGGASERSVIECAQPPGDQEVHEHDRDGTVANAAASGRLLAMPTFA